MARIIKLNKLPLVSDWNAYMRIYSYFFKQPLLPGIRKLETRDVESAYKLLDAYLQKFDLVSMFDRDDFAHFFVPQPDVVYSYVIEVCI